jgi:hypothetical protein
VAPTIATAIAIALAVAIATTVAIAATIAAIITNTVAAVTFVLASAEFLFWCIDGSWQQLGAEDEYKGGGLGEGCCVLSVS